MERIPRQFFTLEFKEEAVSLVVDGGLTVAEVGRRLSVSQQTLRNWIKKHSTTGLNTHGSHNVSELEAEVSRLRKELAEARLEKEILKKANGVPCKGAAGRYAMIDELRKEQGFSVDPMCRTLGVSKSGYYAWKNRKPSARKQEDERLKVAIRAAHERGRGTYGPEKIQDELADVERIEVGINRIKRLRRQMSIRCKQVKKFKATTDSNHNLPVAPNLLDQKFTMSEPNQAWVADITYVATEEGWLYLAAIKDLWNKEIVGYAMSHRMTQDLVGRALFRAVATRRPPKGLIHHSDRGSQYCSRRYQKLMKQFGMKPSMSRKGNCWDNAPMESFFGTLKQEMVHHRRYRTRQQAMGEIREYIEMFYNRQRRHASLGNLSPVTYWKKFIRRQGAA
ncbi:MAG: hypothetical protein C0614_02325 [Desulfuromonas sp.]|nr:MAG: hypothetical protein C0614_02325 [Desulfuromonas sp.]